MNAMSRELETYEIKVSEDANDRYGAFKTGAHDDLATALPGGADGWRQRRDGARGPAGDGGAAQGRVLASVSAVFVLDRP